MLECRVSWVWVGILIFFLALLFLGILATQSYLYIAARKGQYVEKYGHINEITIFLLANLALNCSVTARVFKGGYHCLAHTMWTQAIAAFISAWVTFMAMKTARKIASLEISVKALRRFNPGMAGLWEGDELLAGSVIRFISQHLTVQRIRIIAVVAFVVGFLFYFADATHVRMLKTGKNIPYEDCNSNSASACLIGWYVAVIPVFFVRNTSVVRAAVFNRMKYILIELGVLTVLIVAFLVLNHVLEQPLISAVASSMFLFSTFTYWICESVVPAYTTFRAAAGRGNEEKPRRVPLSLLLAMPKFLVRFEDHLIEEWSLENLAFYKAVVMFQYEASRHLVEGASDSDREHANNVLQRIAFDIYQTFIAPNAKQQLNLPARLSNRLQKYFLKSPYAEWAASRPATQARGLNSEDYSELFDAVVPDREDYKSSELSSTTNVVLNHIGRTRSERVSTGTRTREASRFCAAVAQINAGGRGTQSLEITTVFKEAKKCIFNVMASDPYLRFLNKPAIRKLVQSADVGALSHVERKLQEEATVAYTNARVSGMLESKDEEVGEVARPNRRGTVFDGPERKEAMPREGQYFLMEEGV